MNLKIDIHNNHNVEKKVSSIASWKIPITTKKELVEFIDKARIGQVQEGKRLSERTLSKYLTLLRLCLQIINRQTSKITKEDIEHFDKKLTALNFSSASDYRRCLKVFLKWKIGEDKTRKLAGWLDTRDKTKTPDYLSEQEMTKLYKACKSNAERFLIAVLFDSGARIEEFLNIRLEDIQMPDKNDNFVKIMLKEEYSKTAGRNVSLYWVHTLEAIKDFLKDRQAEGIKSNEAVFNKHYDAVRMFLSRLGKRILNKEVYPHLFRHSSATYYAPKLNRQELCYRYGWAFSSNMPDVYISRAGMESKQLDEKFTNTELGELKSQLSKEEFERKKMKEDNEKKEKEYFEMFANLRKELESLKKEKRKS